MQMRSPECILGLKPSSDVARSPNQCYQQPHKKDQCAPTKKYVFFKIKIEISSESVADSVTDHLLPQIY